MFKISLCIFACLAVVLSAPQVKDTEPIPIVSEEFNIEPDGHFHYSYESGDGSKASESGELKTIDPEHAGISATGEFHFSSPDGHAYDVKYTADENGYQPVGEHLPVAPPIPDLIARSLEYIAAHPTTTEK